MAEIRGIFFDLGWTLETPETGDWMLTERFYEYYPKEQVDAVDRTVWYNALRQASRPLIIHHQMSTLAEEEDAFTGFYYDLMANAGLQISEQTARDISHDRTYSWEKYITMDDTEETLRTLKDRGYRLGIISDTWPSTVPRLEQAGLYSLFDCASFSFEKGIFKPDPAIFRDALAKMGLPAEETVFVDDLVKNLDSASALGIKGVLSLAHGASPDPRYPFIRKPSDILAVLEELHRR